MFVGHYGVAFAVKTERNRIPLWVLFIAVQFLDYIWAILVSSVAVVGYNSLCSRLGYSYRKSTALIVGVAVFSHWILDLLAHPRDLAIYDNTWKVGFGLWNYRDPEFALETGLLGVGVMLYLARNVMPP